MKNKSTNVAPPHNADYVSTLKPVVILGVSALDTPLHVPSFRIDFEDCDGWFYLRLHGMDFIDGRIQWLERRGVLKRVCYGRYRAYYGDALHKRYVLHTLMETLFTTNYER